MGLEVAADQTHPIMPPALVVRQAVDARVSDHRRDLVAARDSELDVSNCTPTVTAYSGYVYASAYAFQGNNVQVFIWYLSSGTATAYDGYFYLNVTC